MIQKMHIMTEVGNHIEGFTDVLVSALSKTSVMHGKIVDIGFIFEWIPGLSR